MGGVLKKIGMSFFDTTKLLLSETFIGLLSFFKKVLYTIFAIVDFVFIKVLGILIIGELLLFFKVINTNLILKVAGFNFLEIKYLIIIFTIVVFSKLICYITCDY